MLLQQQNRTLFNDLFGYPATHSFQAPGRVNLIGEHTDYNQGFVLPCAIDYQTVISCAKRDDNLIRVIAADYDNASDQFSLDEPVLSVRSPLWANYVRGVVKHLHQRNPAFGGMDLVISGNVPQGAGLSSSASLEVAVGTMIQQLWQLDLDPVTLALIGQQAENQFVGCNCGIMDQMISALGEKDHALLLDCRSLETRPVPMPHNAAVVIINSNFKRSLVGSEYNTRREQCDTGARLFNKPSLRDVSLSEFSAMVTDIDPLVARRVRHILTENQRTTDAADALSRGDLVAIGHLMAESHASMRDDFDITVPQIDLLVDIVKSVIGERGGVRMTGGGFGGCIVALIPVGLVEDVRQAVSEQYQPQTGIKETFYVCHASQGAGICHTATSQ